MTRLYIKGTAVKDGDIIYDYIEVPTETIEMFISVGWVLNILDLKS